MILAGDIGGTKTNLAYFTNSGLLAPTVLEKFPSREHSSLDEIVALYIRKHSLKVEKACFGIAGPCVGGRCEATNLPWVIEADSLARCIGIPSVSLVNDLEANAYGIAALRPEDFLTLRPGAASTLDPSGNQAIIAAGTGLGEAGLFWDGREHRPFACECGHTDFAPLDDLQDELLDHLRKKWDHVSYERVVSGMGLVNIYQFLRDTGRGKEPDWLAQAMIEEDAAKVIGTTATAGTSDLCVKALDLMLSVYGAEAGNLALKIMSRGGVYVGGGIAPKVLDRLRKSDFVEQFLAKGRMRDLMEAMPLKVILNDQTALLGAARFACLRALE